jgi:hypothetical protein
MGVEVMERTGVESPARAGEGSGAVGREEEAQGWTSDGPEPDDGLRYTYERRSSGFMSSDLMTERCAGWRGAGSGIRWGRRPSGG